MRTPERTSRAARTTSPTCENFLPANTTRTLPLHGDRAALHEEMMTAMRGVERSTRVFVMNAAHVGVRIPMREAGR